MSSIVNDILGAVVHKPAPKKDFVLRVEFTSDQYAADVFTELIRLAARVDSAISLTKVSTRELT